MRLIVALLAVAATDVLGMVVFGLPVVHFCLSLLPLVIVSGCLSHKAKQ